MKTILMLLKLMRPLNVLLGMISVLIISSFSLDHINIYLTIIVVACFIASSNIINDLFDQKTDQINKRKIIIKSQIIYIYILLSLLLLTGIFSSFQLNYYSRLISLLFVFPLIILYTPIFKGIPILGNLIVGLLVGLVFIFSEISIYQTIQLSILPFLFSFIVMFIREIIKDLEDINGDKANYITTLPIVFGERKTIILSIIIMLLLNLIVLIPFLLSFYNMSYLLAVIIGVILPNSYCIIYFIKKRFKYNYRYIQNIYKMITIVGLIIIYLMKSNFYVN